MGAKYLPTNNDQKATKRFQKSQHEQSKFIQRSGDPKAAPQTRQSPKRGKK